MQSCTLKDKTTEKNTIDVIKPNIVLLSHLFYAHLYSDDLIMQEVKTEKGQQSPVDPEGLPS
jgi:hypothetical protein